MGFFKGFSFGLRGLGWLYRHPGLSRYWLPPVVLTAVIFVALQVVAVRHFGDLLGQVWQGPSEGVCEGVAWYSWKCLGGGLSLVGYWLSGLVAWLLSAALALLLTFLCSAMLSAPFNDALSEAVERAEGGRGEQPFSLSAVVRDGLRSLRLEILKLSVFVMVMAPLLIFSWLVPGVGQILYVLIGGLITVGYLALEFVDWCAARREWSVARRVALLRTHPGTLLGFGCAVWILLVVPVVSLFLMPAAVIGGTLLFLDLERSGLPD